MGYFYGWSFHTDGGNHVGIQREPVSSNAVGVWPMGNSKGAMADYREQCILLNSYSEYSEVAASDDYPQVSFL